MDTKLLLSGFAVLAILGGCATTTIEEMAIATEPDETQPVVVGLAVYEPSSDVANLTESVRHVLNPADIYGAYAFNDAPQKTFRKVRYELPKAQPKKVSTPIVVAQLDRETDPVYEAWRKYCNNSDELTPAEWKLIDRSDMPAELEAIWADECIPLK